MSEIHIEKWGRRIEVRSARPITGLKTTIPGAYQSVSGHWTVPLSVESCILLKQRFGASLVAGNQLKRWVRGAQIARRQMKALSEQKSARVEHLPQIAPWLYKAMRRRKYQLVGVRFIADNLPASMNSDDPGLGKTLIALGGIIEAQVPGPYLVVAPKTATDTVWLREIQRWLPADHKAIIMPQHRYQRERTLARADYGDKTWVIINPEMAQVQAYTQCVAIVNKKLKRRRHDGSYQRVVLPRPCGDKQVVKQKQATILPCGHEKTRRTKFIVEPSYPELFEVEWGALILDESHESLIRRSGQPTQRRRGLDLLALRGDGLKLALSGTPFDSKPHQLWGTLNWLDPKQYSAFHRWSELYWQKGGYTGYEIGEFRKDREGMLWDSLSAICLRRTKAEVAQDLPPKIEVGSPLDPTDPKSPIGVWLEMEGKQAKAYEEMEKLSVTELDGGRLEAITALAELTRLKQLACSYGDIDEEHVKVRCKDEELRWCSDCSRIGWHREIRYKYRPTLPSNKFDWIKENLEEWGYPRNPLTKVVIVSFYTGILGSFADGLEKHFKRKPNAPLCTAITGRTPTSKRRAIIDRFNSGDGPDVMMLNVKAGGTAITIDSADRMIFVSETRIPDQQEQAENRIHRVSNPRQCLYYYLRSLGTVDVGTALVNQEAIQDTHRLLDQRRGVDYMRHVMELSRA